MEEDIKRQIAEQRELLQNVFVSVEKTRKYFMWTMIMSLVFFLLPLIAILVLLPMIMSGLTVGYGGGL
ncbi:MAG: Uncharacterized protein G01um101433_945 [Parcubacteria group bacterium Gr01-1014_33]|nr:MAG: Uncharacterized protein G01um101433_945 [Parcubacteria group bacterium Gr01-1014_33]